MRGASFREMIPSMAPDAATAPVPEAPDRPALSRCIEDRRFLLLQGPSSRFFALLGRALQAKGARVTRFGTRPADRLFWSRASGGYIAYRGLTPDCGAAIRDAIGATGATDLVMLGDGRTAHRAAVDAARDTGPGGPVPWIIEHGLIRPGLILAEPWGTGARSRIADLFDGSSGAEPAFAPAAFPQSFLRYAALDMATNLWNVAAARRYPGHRHHALDGPLREYRGWAEKLARTPQRSRARAASLGRIAQSEGPVFLFPLQLATDFQIRRDGTGAPLETVCREVIESFAAHAPRTATLVVKEHPLDNGLARWEARVPAWARDAGADGRVIHLEGGDQAALFRRLAGCVTVNSSMGLAAVLAGLPVRVLGHAVYDRTGLTDPQPLARFWGRPEPPDAGLAEAFRRFVLTGFHVPGAFDGPGAATGAENLAAWLANPPAVARRAAGAAP